jgi:alkylation response protein AidB-like acyl-CoA dehydrogenase
MRGTGSHHIAATNVELPQERVGSLLDPMWPDDAIFRMRPFDVLGPCLGAVPLGLGRAALDIVEAAARDQADRPPPPGPRRPLADDPLAQIELAQAEVRLRAARALLLEAVDRSYQHAQTGDTPPRHATAVVGLACFEAMRAGAAAVQAACALSGSAAIYPGSLLDRQRCDVQTAGTHIMFSPRIAAALARQAAGIDTVAYPFLPS